MISQNNTPVAWAMFLDELDDASEHLAEMIDDLANDVDYDEENFRIALGHIYAHLNRAWNNRHTASDEYDSNTWFEARQFPDDLEPLA